MNCTGIAVEYGIPLSGIRSLNPDLYCSGITNMTLCAPMLCPIGIVTLGNGTVDATSDTMDISSYVTEYTNFTVADFYAWNPYVQFEFLRHGDPICIGYVIVLSRNLSIFGII